MITVTHSGQDINVAIRRMQNAKRFILRVRFATRDAVLTMPKRASLKDAHDFAERNAAWIAARLNRLPETIPFMEGAVIPIRGLDHILIHQETIRGTVWSAPAEEKTRHMRLYVAGDKAHMHRRVVDFLKREARQDLEKAVSRHTQTVGLTPCRINLRDPVSRWGSCSTNRVLNFSWRLIFAPSFVLDYLAAHEVAHLIHLDHSPQFWKLTYQLCSEVDHAEAWLKTHGTHLHKYGSQK
ncbi:metal-dependent hydrolase [Methylocystaceae bacterium]|nr:metal-dependent hydrolase [Methylocystaceae bacterium]